MASHGRRTLCRWLAEPLSLGVPAELNEIRFPSRADSAHDGIAEDREQDSQKRG